ncbi:MAG: immune inhibitor A domain-containing protein [Gaiellaceae bacterium]
MKRSSWRVLAVVAALGLVIGAVAMVGGAARQSEAAGEAAKLNRLSAARDYYYNMADPQVGPEKSVDVQVSPNGGGSGGGGGSSVDKPLGWKVNARKGAGGFPLAAKQLANLEAQALKTGQNPRHLKQSKSTQTAKLLTILVEFNEDADDDFSGWSRPTDYVTDTPCVTEPAGTSMNGPLHNQIANPATAGLGKDNNSYWVPDFSADHYDTLLYSTTGSTTRVRTDLIGPDGKPGIDPSGMTFRNMYREMSQGAYDVTGDVAGWVKAPHSEAWYGADSCEAGAGSDVGHPDNPNGAAQLVIDAVNAVAAQNPNFPWADYDIEDVIDADEDGNFNEPDGIVDHFVLVHSGVGEEGAGGTEGTYAIWSHSSAVSPGSGGYTVPGKNIKVFNYIVQPEDGHVGVFAHEYGHDLGLPDLYDTSGGGDSDVDFWDLMASGSHTGWLNQLTPTHMGAWDKFVLGWDDPLILNVGKDDRDVQIGQNSNTPVGTKDSVRVNLPVKVVQLATPHSGALAWWTNNDQDWADVKLSRTLQVPAGTDAKFRFWTNYVIEQDWDFDFVEVSTDGGSTWSQQKIYNANGTLASTDDNYTDPHGRLHDYGDLKYGLTGNSGGWKELYVDLSSFTNQTIGLRIRHATDAGFLERGGFYDDFSLVVDGATSFTDDVEGGLNGWTAQTGTFAGTVGAGFIQHGGTFNFNQYYLAEWRNNDGFDKGLESAYDTAFFRPDTGEWTVTRTPYNAPGLLVWYRDIQYGNVNHVTIPRFNPPSIGSKGGLLIVDSHYEPERRTVADGTTLRNMPSRAQSSNAAFNLFGSNPFEECIETAPYVTACTSIPARPAVATFMDRFGWYPGLERRGATPGTGLFFRDIDASVVLPSRDNRRYTTRTVLPDGTPDTASYGLNVSGSRLGTGNPADGHAPEHTDDVSLGVSFEVVRVAKNNTYATVHVTPAKP